MAIYAFDGTGNKDNLGDSLDTNVVKFSSAFKDGDNGSGNPFYVEGVGTRKGFIGQIFGSIFGAGGEQRIDEAIDALEKNFEDGDKEINIIGFSRGSALALEFANEINEHGINGEESPIINFIGIWDTVASFGIPGNNINIGLTLTVPKNVINCFHAMALDERRQTFPLTRAFQDAYSNTEALNLQEVWFRGFHSDIGGGNDNEPLSSIPLVWMLRRALDVGIDIPDAHMQQHAALSDPSGACEKPGMDIFANKKRTVLHTDTVHDSVSRREWAARSFKANNPPKMLNVTNDNGSILAKGFEET